METIILQVKDHNKLDFLLELLKQLDFVELIREEQKSPKIEQKEEDNDFFQLAGIWEGRNVDADELRKKAWGRK